MQWQYVISPLFGAVIGYTTNWIAIKMLFRPLEEKKIFGIKVPFTPGVIPRERQRIAVSVGNAVGGYLLTEEQITRTLLERKTEVSLRRFIRLTIHQVLESDLTVKESVLKINGVDEKYLNELIENLSSRICKAVLSQNSEVFISQYLKNLLNDFLNSPVSDTLTEQQLESFSKSAVNGLEGLLENKQIEAGIKKYIDKKLIKLIESKEPIGNYIPSSLVLELENFLSLQGPEMIRFLKQYLQSPEIKIIITKRMEKFFESHLGNKFLGLISNVVKKSSQKLTEKIYDTINKFLLDENLQKELVRFLQEILRSLLKTEVRVLAQKVHLDQKSTREEWSNWFYQQLIEVVNIKTIEKYVEDFIEKNKNNTWKELLKTISLSENKLNSLLEDLVHRLFSSPEVMLLVKNKLQGFISSLLNKKIYELAGSLQKKDVFKFTELIISNSQLLIPKYTPVFLKTINIQQMVQRSVDNLDVSQVENVLLGVTKKELSYITWFGALLGFIIGIFIPVLQVLTTG